MRVMDGNLSRSIKSNRQILLRLSYKIRNTIAKITTHKQKIVGSLRKKEPQFAPIDCNLKRIESYHTRSRSTKAAKITQKIVSKNTASTQTASYQSPL